MAVHSLLQLSERWPRHIWLGGSMKFASLEWGWSLFPSLLEESWHDWNIVDWDIKPLLNQYFRSFEKVNSLTAKKQRINPIVSFRRSFLPSIHFDHSECITIQPPIIAKPLKTDCWISNDLDNSNWIICRIFSKKDSTRSDCSSRSSLIWGYFVCAYFFLSVLCWHHNSLFTLTPQIMI